MVQGIWAMLSKLLPMIMGSGMGGGKGSTGAGAGDATAGIAPKASQMGPAQKPALPGPLQTLGGSKAPMNLMGFPSMQKTGYGDLIKRMLGQVRGGM